VAGTVITQLDLPETTKEVQQKISAEVQSGTDLLVVSATDPSAARSRDIVTTATTTLVALAKQLDPPNAAAAANGTTPASINIAQEAVTARQPNGLVRNGGFSAALGLLIGAAAVAIRESTRKTVTEERDLRRLGIATVGVISLGGRSGRSGVGYEALAEGFRRLRSLLPAVPDTAPAGRGRSLLLTASNADEGTTAVACGLAIAMAETGSRVVLVDANLRTPGVGRYLSMDTSHGLADVLAGTAEVSDVLQDSLDGRLTVLPSGQQLPDPGEILASPALGATVRDLTERFDLVLVDAPALHAVADATVLSKVTDSALLVVRAGRTRTADVERSTDLLERVGAQLAGAVLNALPRKLRTGSSWNRVGVMGPAAEPALGVGRLGDGESDGRADAGTDEPREAPIWEPPRADIVSARGRARVVNGVVTSGPDEDEDEATTAWAAGTPARGQARVVVITDAQPPVAGSAAAAAAASASGGSTSGESASGGSASGGSASGDEWADGPRLPAQRDSNPKQQPGE
jgi:capsular exopolysaccharide synthesis family protein